jgi:steroid delta-isomerase-like uncharacterized protein
MPDSRAIVEQFYNGIWNRQDFAAAGEILAADFRFRGSLGCESSGVPAFLAYVKSIHAALGDYCCTIEELIAEADRAAARMTFVGKHQGPLFGVPATGRKLSWAGAAFFKIAQGRIVSLWVLGDVEGLKQQLGAGGDPPF